MGFLYIYISTSYLNDLSKGYFPLKEAVQQPLIGERLSFLNLCGGAAGSHWTSVSRTHYDPDAITLLKV